MTVSPKDNQLQPVSYEKQAGNPLFPVFLKLNQLHTVLVGAGNVGLEKLSAILQNSPDAKVTVIALAVHLEVEALAAGNERLNIIQKSFADSDLDNADIVIAATNNGELNNFIRQSAHERRLLINVADKPELCDFYLGSIVQKGDLKIAISTNGKSPTIAKRLKQVLNEALPAELDITLQQISRLRNSLSGDFTAKVKALNEITSVLVDQPKAKTSTRIWVKIVMIAAAAVVIMVVLKVLQLF